MAHKTLAGAFAVLSLLATALPARADLHYTVHTSAHKEADTDPADRAAALAGAMLLAVANAQDRTDSYFLSGSGMRMESGAGTIITPDGAVMLMLADGTMATLNPADKTFWRMPDLSQAMPPQAAGLLAAMRPAVSVTRTGEFQTVAGVQAEHVTVTISMKLPLPPGLPAGSGFPDTMQMTMDDWIAGSLAEYSAFAKNASQANTFATMMGISLDLPPGLVVRQTLRGTMFGNVVVEMNTSDIVEGSLAPELFQIPADYREVKMPVPDIGALMQQMQRGR